MRRVCLPLALFILGCGGGATKTCTTACEKLQSCGVTTPCQLSAVCTDAEKCLAACIQSATCAEIIQGAASFMTCQAACGAAPLPDGGPPSNDGEPQLDQTPPKLDQTTPKQDQTPPKLDGPKLDGPKQDSTPKDKGGPEINPPPDQGPKDQSSADQNPPQDGSTPWKSWVAIPKGSFDMGSPLSELCREPGTAKETLHFVTLSHGFKIAATEVTQGQFLAQMGYNPSHHAFCGKSCPVEKVTWHEAAAYCNKLSQNAQLTQCYVKSGSGAFCVNDSDCAVTTEACINGTCTAYGVATPYGGVTADIYDCPGYRLPTEAEWEYAYRAATSTAFYNGGIGDCVVDSKAGAMGWYTNNAGGKTHPVGLKLPNGWGLYDMAGNVWEWVHDGYVSDLGGAGIVDPVLPPTKMSMVVRGGSWSRPAGNLRAAHRFSYGPRNRGGNRGFRCVRSLP